MSFEREDLTRRQRSDQAWRRLKEVMTDGEVKEIQAAFDEAYHADEAEAEASVRIRREGSRLDPVSPPSKKRGRASHED